MGQMYLTSKLTKSKRTCVISSDALCKVNVHDILSVLGEGNPGFVNHPASSDDCPSHKNRTVDKYGEKNELTGKSPSSLIVWWTL